VIVKGTPTGLSYFLPTIFWELHIPAERKKKKKKKSRLLSSELKGRGNEQRTTFAPEWDYYLVVKEGGKVALAEQVAREKKGIQ